MKITLKFSLLEIIFLLTITFIHHSSCPKNKSKQENAKKEIVKIGNEEIDTAEKLCYRLLLNTSFWDGDVLRQKSYDIVSENFIPSYFEEKFKTETSSAGTSSRGDANKTVLTIKRSYHTGLENFKLSFNEVSMSRIHLKYGIPPTEVKTEMEKIRELERALAEYYFKDLFKNHGFDFKITMLDSWCESHVQKFESRIKREYIRGVNEFYDSLLDDDQLAMCKKFTSDLLLINGKDGVFKTMYENWTHTDLLFGHLEAANDLFDDSKIIEKQKSRFYTTEYSYNFYLEVYNEIQNLEGTSYSSITDFCGSAGKFIVNLYGFFSNLAQVPSTSNT